MYKLIKIASIQNNFKIPRFINKRIIFMIYINKSNMMLENKIHQVTVKFKSLPVKITRIYMTLKILKI